MKKIAASKKVFWYAVIAMFMAGSFQVPAAADIVSTNQILMESKADATKAELGALLQRSDVQEQLVSLGVDVADAQKRIDSMTDSELASAYGQLEMLPAGEGAAGLILTILLIFILLDLAGVTNIFPGI